MMFAVDPEPADVHLQDPQGVHGEHSQRDPAPDPRADPVAAAAGWCPTRHVRLLPGNSRPAQAGLQRPATGD